MINKCYKHFYLVGICGVGMSQLASLLKEAGYIVSGSDEEFYPPMGDFLKSLKIKLFKGYKEENINNDPDVFIIGNSVTRGNREVEKILAERKPYYSFCEVVRELFIRGKKSIVITGTHGKTTITSLCSFILDHCGLEPSFLIGGMPLNFSRGSQFKNSDFFVIEGDEYDTSFFDKRPKFLNYLPFIAVINNIEFDHADIYQNLDSIKLQFKRLTNIIPINGKIIANAECPNTKEVVNNCISPVETYGFSESSDWRAINILSQNEKTTFDVLKKGIPYENFSINTTGKFNVLNTLACIAVCDSLQLEPLKIKSAISLFKGVKRRMELISVINGISIYDDFAHHPTAISETISAIRSKHKNGKIFAIFEPRSWTARMNFFQNEFTKSFDLADKVIFSKVFKEDKIPEDKRLNIKKLIKDLQAKGREAFYFENVSDIIKFCKDNAQSEDIILIMSNGSFDNIQTRLIQALQ